MTKCCRTDVTILSIGVAMVESVNSAADGIYQATEKLNDYEIKLVNSTDGEHEEAQLMTTYC